MEGWCDLRCQASLVCGQKGHWLQALPPQTVPAPLKLPPHPSEQSMNLHPFSIYACCRSVSLSMGIQAAKGNQETSSLGWMEQAADKDPGQGCQPSPFQLILNFQRKQT